MKKKISIVTSGHPYYDERIFYKFARSLVKNDYDVSIICSTAESEIDFTKDNIHIIGFDGSNLNKSKKVSKFEEYLKTTAPDVIICCEPLPILAANRIRKKSKHVKIIYDITEWYPHQNMLKQLNNLTRKLNAIYLFLFNIYAASRSNFLIIGEARKAIPYKIFLPLYKKKIIGYYPSKEFFKYSAPPYDNKTLTICYVGIINKERGIFTFLSVIKKLQTDFPNISILGKIIGNFEDETVNKKVLEFINSNTNLRIELVPRVSYEEMSKQLIDVDICLDLRIKNFVYNNSFPIKIFDFMACGKPVVYSSIKPLTRFSDINKFGFLVDPNNLDSICKQIALYIENPELLQTHSQKARKLFENKYNWESIENLLLDAIEKN
jgi:glycosyltransferase involved in cell wall biosynthesis